MEKRNIRESAQTCSPQTYTVTVTGYGAGGDGIGRLDDGRVVFIRNAARGDILKVKLTKEQSRSAIAEIVRILSPSVCRIEPDCPVYPECGGCDFRHITYEEELDAKLHRVNDAMARIGKLPVSVSEILRTGQIDGYRNKAVLHCDGNSLGFYRAQSHDIIPISHCMLLKDDINSVIKEYRECRGSGEGGEPARGDEITLRSGGEPAQGDEITLRSGGEPAQGDEIILRSGRNGLLPPIEEELDGLVFGISGFFQVNTRAALLLYRKAREYAALSKNDTLVELYCGVGSLTLFAGRDAGFALGVEIDSASTEEARKNARRNKISHIEFINADAAEWEAEISRLDCLIVDPPRKGLSPDVIRKILELSPGRIVYISCDPATLARDLRELSGYSVKDICAVDMFPRTANVECCCLLVKA